MASGNSVKLETTGSFSVKRMPELGTVRFSISAESEDASEVFPKAKAACDELSAQLRKLAAPKAETSSASIESEEHDINDQKLDPAFPIANWSLNEISTSHYNQFPDNNPPHPAMRRAIEEKPKPTTIYCANARAKATFHDFSALAETIAALTANPIISIDSVNWDVTRATRTALKSRVRTGAYADALSTAKDYAASISPNAEPRPVCVKARHDGMEAMPVASRALYGAARAKAVDEAPSFEPEPISISTSVSVEFELAL